MPRHRNPVGVGQRAFDELTALIYRKDCDVCPFCRNHGLSVQSVQTWRKGGCPSIQALQRLDALGLNIHYILSGNRP